MILNLEYYTELKLHNDLTALEEIVYLYAVDQDINGPVVVSTIAATLGMSVRHIREVVTALERKEYITRGRGTILPNYSLLNENHISPEFIFYDDFSVEHKKALVGLYRSCLGKQYINLQKLELTEPLIYTREALEQVTDEGYNLYGEPFDFDRVFALESLWDEQ